MVQLRPMEEKDNKEMHVIIQRILKSHGLDIPGTAYFDPQLGELWNFYQPLSNGTYWVLEEEGQVIGGIGVAPFVGQPKIGELQKLYIDEAYQGKGYSRLLLEQAISFAREHFPALYLETTDILAKANAIYPSYGFVLLDKPLAGSEHGAMNRWFLLDFNEEKA